MISRKCPTGRLFVPRSVCHAVLRWSHASRLLAHPGIRGTLCVTISLCVLLDFFVRLLYYTAILTALFLMTTATLLCLIKYCPVLSSQVESCRVSDLFSAQSPSCLRPVVRLPPGAALRTVLQWKLPLRPGPHSLSFKSSLLLCSSLCPCIIFQFSKCLIWLANSRLLENKFSV